MTTDTMQNRLWAYQADTKPRSLAAHADAWASCEPGIAEARALAIAARRATGCEPYRIGAGWWIWPHRDLTRKPDFHSGECELSGAAHFDHSYLAVADRRPVYCAEPYPNRGEPGAAEDLAEVQAVAAETFAPLAPKGWRWSVTREGAIHVPGHTVLIQLYPPLMTDGEWLAELDYLAHGWARADPFERSILRRRSRELREGLPMLSHKVGPLLW